MQRKKVSLSEIYDNIAVRILVNNIEECYNVLSIAHQLWENIPEEFDDYIANPKPSGYRSLHTAVTGPEGKTFEVQIRTIQMHDEAELGVAAHWAYKEGAAAKKQSHERKIDWLRQVLDWQKELTEQEPSLDNVDQEFLEDRIYVFTPSGDILDLASGATPLDFAYTVHSEVGHRCRGAKVDNKIVPLNYQLKTGEQVHILTTKQGKPSLDWLSPHLGYLKTSRAKAKVHHWFKQQDHDKHLQAGKEALERELRKLDLEKQIKLDDIASQFNFQRTNDFFVAIGNGDLGIHHILNRIQSKLTPKTEEVLKPAPIHKRPKSADSAIAIEGVGNLLTHISKCCKPIPGDSIIGYITQGRGVSIHKQDCPNILHASEAQHQRFINVTWQAQIKEVYPVDINVKAYDRKDLLRDITNIVSNEKANVLGISTHTDKTDQLANIHLSVEINSIEALSRLLEKINSLANVMSVNRLAR